MRIFYSLSTGAESVSFVPLFGGRDTEGFLGEFDQFRGGFFFGVFECGWDVGRQGKDIRFTGFFIHACRSGQKGLVTVQFDGDFVEVSASFPEALADGDGDDGVLEFWLFWKCSKHAWLAFV